MWEKNMGKKSGRRWIVAAFASAAFSFDLPPAAAESYESLSYEELQVRHRELSARLRAMEAAGLVQPTPHDHDEHHAHEHGAHDDHAHADDHAHTDSHAHGEDEWRWEDPYYPGWWRPSDEYRPYSWMSPPSEGFLRDLLAGQFIETHRSSAGTPWVHPFTIEPPQLHRDLFMFYKYTKDAEGSLVDEHEMEVHLDWALTRRFGILVAAPFLGMIGPNEQAAGFGDIEIAPRVVMVEQDKFYLAANVFVTVPTGDESRDLGAGETTIAPFLTTWHDLGSWAPWTNWNTAYINVGPESGVSTGETSLVYTAVYAHSFLGPKLIFPHQHGGGNGNGNGHAHNGDSHAHEGGVISPMGPGYPIGLTNIIVELNGQSELYDERSTYLQLLGGVSYILTDSSEVRFGVNVPLNRKEEQMAVQYILGFTYVF
jgi:hypothetical protein